MIQIEKKEKLAHTEANKRAIQIIRKNGGKPTSKTVKYEGDLLNGMRHGRGTLRVGKQVEYFGEFAFDKKEGYGQLTTEKEVYLGCWKGGLKDGAGKNSFADGSSFKGHFHEGLKQGFGMFSRESMHFTGFWKHDLKQGQFMAFCVDTGQALEILYQDDQVCAVEKLNNSNKFDESLKIDLAQDLQIQELDLKHSAIQEELCSKIEELKKIIEMPLRDVLNQNSSFACIIQSSNQTRSEKKSDQGLHLL